MAVFLFDATTRWSSVRLDAVCLLITLATFFLVTLIPSNLLTPALAAMALTYSMNVSSELESVYLTLGNCLLLQKQQVSCSVNK